jgi:hypothetical protein
MRIYFRLSRITNQLDEARVLHEKLTAAQPVQKFYTYYGIQSYITVFILAPHSILSYTKWPQVTPSQPVSYASL